MIFKVSDSSAEAASDRRIEIALNPKELTRCFGILVLCLFVAHTIVQSIRFLTGSDGSMHGIVPLFSLGSDGNLPTYYSSIALLFCAILLGVITLATRATGQRDVIYWLGLTMAFLFLALDEMLMLHEHLIEPLRNRMNTSGLLFYAWVIPYGIATLVFGAVYVRFLRRLPSRTAIQFLVAGAMFVAGALGMEMLGGLYFESYGGQTPGYVALQTVEETLEMVGVVVFLHAVATYLVEHFGPLRVRFAVD